MPPVLSVSGEFQNGSYPKNYWGGNDNVDFNKSLYCNNIYHPLFNNITFNEHWLPLHAEDAGYKTVIGSSMEY